MSERQAKRRRQNEMSQTQPVKKASGATILTNCVITVVILALLGLGAWAVYDEIQQNNATQSAQEQIDNLEGDFVSVETYAQDLGMTGDEFLAEYGLSEVSGVTASTDMSTAVEHMTLSNYAKLQEMEIPELLESMGITNTFDENALMADVFAELYAQVEASEE